MYTREFEWRTLNGKFIKIKDLNNIHLVNIIYHVRQGYGKYSNRDQLLKILYDELTIKRGFDKRLLNYAPYPYQDEYGYWWVWDYKTHKKKAVQSHYIWTPQELLSTMKYECECGADKHGFANHSDWCPKYK